MKRMHRNKILALGLAIVIIVAANGVSQVYAQGAASFATVMNHIKVGWLKLASVEASQAVESSIPLDSEFLTLCGFILSTSGQPDLARQAYLRAMENSELTPAEKGSFLALVGRTYLDQQEYQQAKDYHLQALETAGDEVFSLVDLGIIYLKEGELSSARQYLDRAETVGGTESPRLYMVRGDVALATSDYDEAIGQYQTALTLAPSDQQLYYRLKHVFQQTGKEDKVLALVEQARSYGIELN